MTAELTGWIDTAMKTSLIAPYACVVFDCDGVLLDSNRFKTEAFRTVLAFNGLDVAQIEAFCAFQATNFGISRYRMFELLLKGQFGRRPAIALEELLKQFSAACREGYLGQGETEGMREALARAGADDRALYVVSGSDENELREILEIRGIAGAFASIFGSPANKIENLARVRAHRLDRGASPDERLLFVGDAFADMEAAAAAAADFVFMARYSTVRAELEPTVRAAGLPVIEDLREI